MMEGMQRFVPVEELFKGRHFDQEIVVLNVRWYLTYKLSYRDLVAMMAERALVQTRAESAMMDKCHDSFLSKSYLKVGTLTRRSWCYASAGI